MTLRALLVFSSLSIVAGTVCAAEGTAPYNALLGSYLKTDSQRDGDNGFGGMSIFGFSLARHLNLELSGYGSVVSRNSDSGTDGIIGIGADLQQLLTPGPLQLFVVGGGGGEYDKLGTAARHDSYAPYLDAGLGVIARLGRRLDLRAEARGYAVFNDKAYAGSDPLVDLRVNLGLQYSFGTAATTKSADRHIEPAAGPCGTGTNAVTGGCAAASPQPAAVDTDGDGVPDSRDQCPGTPAGTAVDARGCPLVLDSDGDGVVDALDQCPGTPLGFKVDAVGCIVEQTVVLKTVNFDFGTDRLSTEAKATLDQVAASLLTQPALRIEISGHTDSLGPQAYNLTLSQRRVAAVKNYLVAHGVAGDRLSAEGYGEFSPIASNETERGRAQNRRVEFKVLNRRTGATR